VAEVTRNEKSRQAGQAASSGLTVMTRSVAINGMNSLCTPGKHNNVS
jgi:hypothetical protein